MTAPTGPGIYRSAHPDVLAAWNDGIVQFEDWKKRFNEKIVEWGFPAGHSFFVQSMGFGSGSRVVGLAKVDSIPEGWRLESKHRLIVPARTTKAGKAVAKDFDAMRVEPNPKRRLAKLGMPTHFFWSLRVGTYGAVLDGDNVLWVRWSSPVDGVDDTYWQHVPLSQFYAMVESGTDPFAIPASGEEES